MGDLGVPAGIRAQRELLGADGYVNGPSPGRRPGRRGEVEHAELGHHRPASVDPREHVDLPHEARRPPIRRTRVYILGLADLHQAAVAHHRQAIGERQRLLLVVCDEQGCRARLPQDQLDLAAELGTERGVEARERLVEQDDVGLRCERPSEGDALALSSGELVREAVGLVLEADELQRRRGARAVAPREAEGHVPGHCEVRKERVVLKHHPDASLLGGHVQARPRGEPTADGYLSPLRALEPCHEPEERGLPASGRT